MFSLNVLHRLFLVRVVCILLFGSFLQSCDIFFIIIVLLYYYDWPFSIIGYKQFTIIAICILSDSSRKENKMISTTLLEDIKTSRDTIIKTKRIDRGLLRLTLRRKSTKRKGCVMITCLQIAPPPYPRLLLSRKCTIYLAYILLVFV